jgi:hypothetical protein
MIEGSSTAWHLTAKQDKTGRIVALRVHLSTWKDVGVFLEQCLESVLKVPTK